MNTSRNRIIAIVVVIFVTVLAFIVFNDDKADASSAAPCVPSAAIPAVPGTPAIPAVPGTPAIPAVPAVTQTVPATSDLWWNWSPNKTKGPQDYTPAFPVDARGTWQGPHANGGPQQGTYGTFNTSNGNSGNSSWFHRQQGTPETTIVITPAKPAVPGTPDIAEIPAVPGKPAVPAVTCPTTPTETPTVAVEPPVTVPAPVPDADKGPYTICGIKVYPPKPGEPIMRDILCPMPGDEDPEIEDEKDPVAKIETSSSQTRTVKVYTHESGKTTEVVRNYGDISQLKEEGL